MYKEYLENIKNKNRMWEERLATIEERMEELERWLKEKIEVLESRGEAYCMEEEGREQAENS